MRRLMREFLERQEREGSFRLEIRRRPKEANWTRRPEPFSAFKTGSVAYDLAAYSRKYPKSVPARTASVVRFAKPAFMLLR